jgi:hypothetical protein
MPSVELRRLAVFHAGAITTITPGILRSFLAQHRHLKPASRAPGRSRPNATMDTCTGHEKAGTALAYSGRYD